MYKIVTLLFLPFIFFGCSTTEKLTYPKGDWVEVNSKEYVPENTPKYVKDKTKEGVFNEI